MTKQLKKNVCNKILEDSSLSMALAKALGIKQNSVEQLARRNSDKLLNINAIEVFKQHGLTEDEIFEDEPDPKEEVTK